MGGMGALAQAGTQPTASQISDLEQLRSTGLRFDDKNGIPHDQWLDNAESRNASSELKAQYKELVDIAGGLTDRPSLLRAMEVAQAYLAASDPAATASDHMAFERTLADNLTFQLGRLDPAALLTSPLQSAARLMLEQSGATDTEWGRSLDRALGHSVAFNAGLAEGVWQGGTDMVTGIATMAGKALQFGADNSLLGRAGDALRGLTGQLPEWLETWTPSATRGAASSEALGQAMANAVDYIASNSPAEVAGDIRHAIAAQWGSLRASHAAAAAQGPEAEARWWGQTIGRVGFEIGATFVPVAGQAGRIGTAARVADGAVDAVRAAGGIDGATDASRLGNSVDEVSAAARIANGFVRYGSLDSLGRPTGVTARITQDMIGTGTAANRNIIPPGWSGNGRLHNEARAHLLGRQLGGSGDVPENLVTFAQNPANSPVMSGFEAQIRAAVERGEVLDFRATPVYDGNILVPRAITLEASGSNGFSLQVSILNQGP